MRGQECEKLAKENNWDLVTKNACHIAVQNEEQGELRDAQIVQNTTIEALSGEVEIIGDKVNIISWQTGFTSSVLGLIGVIVISWVVKKILDSIKFKKK